MSVEADFYFGEGFIGARLTWNIVFMLNQGGYWDVLFVPSQGNESVTINRKTCHTDSAGILRLFVNYTNNTANDTYFGWDLINVPSH